MKGRMNTIQDKVGQIFLQNSTYITSDDNKFVCIQDEGWLDEDVEPIEKALIKAGDSLL